MGIKCTDGVVLVSALSPPTLAPGAKQAAHPCPDSPHAAARLLPPSLKQIGCLSMLCCQGQNSAGPFLHGTAPLSPPAPCFSSERLPTHPCPLVGRGEDHCLKDAGGGLQQEDVCSRHPCWSGEVLRLSLQQLAIVYRLLPLKAPQCAICPACHVRAGCSKLKLKPGCIAPGKVIWKAEPTCPALCAAVGCWRRVS